MVQDLIVSFQKFQTHHNSSGHQTKLLGSFCPPMLNLKQAAIIEGRHTSVCRRSQWPSMGQKQALSLKQLLQSICEGSFLLRQMPVTKVKYVTSDPNIIDWHWEQQQNNTNVGLVENPRDELWTFKARSATSKAWWRHENVLEPKNMPIQRVLTVLGITSSDSCKC